MLVPLYEASRFPVLTDKIAGKQPCAASLRRLPLTILALFLGLIQFSLVARILVFSKKLTENRASVLPALRREDITQSGDCWPYSRYQIAFGPDDTVYRL